MKKSTQIISITLAILLIISSMFIAASSAWDGTTVASGFASGTGTEADPYIIATPEQFIFFADSTIGGETYAGKFIKQTADLDFGGADLYSATAKHMVTGFAGTYNGAGFKISNAKYSKKDAATTPTGIFSTVVGGTVKGIAAEKITITNAYYGGIIAGAISEGATISACTVDKDSSIAGFERVGGIVGSADGTATKKAVIEYCSNNAAVSAAASKNNSYAAGIAGYANAATIRYCENTGKISANASGNSKNGVAAGILGVAGNSSGSEADVEYCANSGEISAPYSGSNTARNYAGGIVGRAANSDGNADARSSIKNCVNTGSLVNASTNATYFGYIGQIAAVYAASGHTTVKDCKGLSSISTSLSNSYPDYANGTNYLLGKYGDTNIVSDGNTLADATVCQTEIGKITKKIEDAVKALAPEPEVTTAEITTAEPVVTTSPEVTTSAPVVTTAPEVTTSAPVVTTSPEVTTAAPAVTTSPEITTPAPVVTTSSEATTQQGQQNPPVTGDNVWIWAVAVLIVAISFAVVFVKREKN